MVSMASTAASRQHSQIWWIYLLYGTAAILLGLMLVTAPGITLLALTPFLGLYWLISGVLALVRTFIDRSVPWIWSLLVGILGIAAGLFVLRHTLVAALTVPAAIVIVLGMQALVMGALDIVGGLTGGGIGSFVLGGINILLGVLLLAAPLVAFLAMPIVFGAILLVQGIVLVSWAFHVRG
jgi:uncharacterized membrane protein HdeD (DUF308 family)